MTERDRMERELERLEPSRRARAVHLRRDDASLAAALERMKADEDRVRREGHIASSGFGLRPV